MSWNQHFTHSKQKEMTQKSISYQKKRRNDPYQYTTYYKPPLNSSENRKEIERQRRVKIISVIIITLVCVIGISVITYFATT